MLAIFHKYSLNKYNSIDYYNIVYIIYIVVCIVYVIFIFRRVKFIIIQIYKCILINKYNLTQLAIVCIPRKFD